VRDEDGVPVALNSFHSTAKGEVVRIVGGRAPHKEGSTGRIYFKDVECRDGEFFPSVCNCHWEPIP
jgi:hypothetical protein